MNKANSTSRVNCYRKKQLALGNKKREYYLNDTEWVMVKAFIFELRK